MQMNNRYNSRSGSNHAPGLHALWSRSDAELSNSSQFDALLRMLKARFGVSSVMVVMADEKGAAVKMLAGPDPLTSDHSQALILCKSSSETVFVAENIPPAVQVNASNTSVTSVRFYAGAPLLIRVGGKPAGLLCMMATQPKSFTESDRLFFKSLASAVSAMLVMPHNPTMAIAIGLAAEKSVLLINETQAIEAVNQRFSQLTGFSAADLERTDINQLLCLDRLHSGARVLDHALLSELPAQAMTRCHIKNSGTIPVEVFVLPLQDRHGQTPKTLLLMAPLFSGPIESFLLSLDAAERSELLSLHLAGLWAVDHMGRILKLSGAPIAHIEESNHAYLLGKKLHEAAVFDTLQTDWTDFYKSVAADKLPAEVECCVTYCGQSLWYSMKGFRQADANGTTIGYHGSFRDITESKRRELALRKSEERLSLIVKGTNDGAWDWDLQTGDYYLSLRWWTMMGRSPETQQGRTEIWMEFIHPDDRKVVRATFNAAVRKGLNSYQCEFRLQHLHGHYIPILGRGHILYNTQGKPVRTSGTNVDLTQQRQAQSQITLLKSCVESLRDVVIVTHASPRKSPGPIIAYVNPAFERSTGFSAEEVIGKTPRLLQGPLTCRNELEKITDAMQHWQPVKVELANYKKNGELFWAEIEITPVQADGSQRFTHWIGVQRDITQRKLSEQALHATTERLTLAVEATRLGLWTRHVADNVNYRDARWYDMLGYAPDNQPELPTNWLKFVHPDDVARIQEEEQKAIASGDASFEHEFRMRHADGHWVWIHSRGRIIERNKAGQPLTIAGTHMDITARVEAQLVTERHNEQLSRCLEHLSVGVFLHRNGIVKFANSTLRSFFGATHSDDISGMSLMAHLSPGDIEIAIQRQDQLMAGAILPSFWYNCVRCDGSVFKVLTRSTVIEWEGERHILSTITMPGDVALFSKEIETNRNRYESLLAKQVEENQVRVAHELHDSLGSQLAGISLHAASIKLMGESTGRVVHEINLLLENIKKAAEMTRDLARGLAPVDAWPGAFWRALEKLCIEFSRIDGLSCTFDMHGDFDTVTVEVGNHLYRITQEAITNALRHGHAQHICVSLHRNAVGEYNVMTLTVLDDGVGFETHALASEHRNGVGLSSMYARARAINADITLERAAPKGSRVLVTWRG